ncbi:SDR family oxidoreductase [Paeniglutamicibacter sp. ZC-3]|uniref:SDR family NAD(P)-dependent oxidoreductase n=1 Tax=Paeniglutamicibacter sp. ZC-3 TaxID=2986919 RepID=UPI0021F6E693|nr:SDR family oxidoreductase [Paeniglutamicibacter sp. ZC-3]MCV9996602.1 SDR family oxidoreductase [Paeniglutamicibacter sp. ZC-3]
MIEEFAGLTAVVTGGASGIGRATAEELTARGASVAVLDLNPEEAPVGATGFLCDVGSTESVTTAIQAVVERFGGIDILVNNAGIGAQGDVAANTDDEWDRVLNVNVKSIARLSRSALPHLRASKHAAIVNTSSIAATAGLPQRVLYAASKGAIQAMTLSMAADHVREGIRVNCVNPGTANTPWIVNLLGSEEDPEAERAALNSRQPHGRMVEPNEVAQAICYLASPRNGSTAGISLAVDGGMNGLRLRPVGS